jgi:hypothetical protein
MASKNSPSPSHFVLRYLSRNGYPIIVRPALSADPLGSVVEGHRTMNGKVPAHFSGGCQSELNRHGFIARGLPRVVIAAKAAIQN